MILLFHVWLTLAMSIIFWSKVYITFQKRRQNPEERKADLIINSIFALLFTIAFMDIIMTIPQIAYLLESTYTFMVTP